MTTNNVPTAVGEAAVRTPGDETTAWRAVRTAVGAVCLGVGAGALFTSDNDFLFTAAAVIVGLVSTALVATAVAARGVWRLLAPVVSALVFTGAVLAGSWLALAATPLAAWIASRIARAPMLRTRMDLAEAGLRAEGRVTALQRHHWDLRTPVSAVDSAELGNVADQLAQLPAPWQAVIRPDQSAAVAVGHAGAVLVVPVSVFDNGPHELLHMPASTVEHGESDALWRQQVREMLELPHGNSVAYVRDALGDTSGAADEFSTPDGTPAGFLLPGAAIEQAVRVAMALNLGDARPPTVVFTVRGPRLNAPYGRVVVRDEHGYWLGVAWVCAPDRLADLVESLPGQAGHLEQVEVMGAALETLWAPPSPMRTARQWFTRG